MLHAKIIKRAEAQGMDPKSKRRAGKRDKKTGKQQHHSGSETMSSESNNLSPRSRIEYAERSTVSDKPRKRFSSELCPQRSVHFEGSPEAPVEFDVIRPLANRRRHFSSSSSRAVLKSGEQD